jgi:hypothetical protein
MEKLMAELRRLYLPADAVQDEALARRLRGETGVPLGLAADDGRVRALSMSFGRIRKAEEGEHWRRLCAVANSLQGDLDLPAPGVAIDGETGYHLWLSLATPVPPALAQEFLALLRRACLPDTDPVPEAPAGLPPYLHERSGKWAAFIHPGMGASFADDPGLDMMPPLLGQAAFLEGLESIADEQFGAALARLRQAHGAVPATLPAVVSTPVPALVPTPVPVAAPAASPPADGLLLKDATLEDIVRFLHAKNIEPTFRHLMPNVAQP